MITDHSSYIPSLAEVETAILSFQGTVKQIPPMFSAKKQKGQKLYDLARKGIIVDRPPITVQMQTTLLEYTYPIVRLQGAMVCVRARQGQVAAPGK